jgi:hypothetical protein
MPDYHEIAAGKGVRLAEEGLPVPSHALHRGSAGRERRWSVLAGLAGLAMLGRGICRGRIRGVFWWHRPAWLQDPPRSTAT